MGKKDEAPKADWRNVKRNGTLQRAKENAQARGRQEREARRAERRSSR